MQKFAENVCFLCGGKVVPSDFPDYERCVHCSHHVQITCEAPPLVNEALRASWIQRQDAKDRFQLRVALGATRTREYLLDIGSGSGRFLYHARQFFRTVVGVEVSQPCIEFARRELQLEVLDALTPKVTARASVITMWHSLEHLNRELITSMFELFSSSLGDSASLVISVPNVTSVHFQVFGKRSVYYDPLHHYHQFSWQSLQMLVHRYGLKISAAKTGFAYSYFGNLLSLLNLVSGKHNALYSAMRRDGRCGQKERMLLLWLPVFALPALLFYLFELAFPDKGAVATIIVRRDAAQDIEPRDRE